MRLLAPRTALGAGAVAAIALAGCAAQSTAAQKPGSEGPSVTTARSPQAAASPQQQAETDAGTILASFAVPSGAVKLTAAPSAAADALNTPIQIPGSTDLVDKTSWWLAPGNPQAVLAWEAKHVSRQYAFGGTGTVSNGGHVSIQSDTFSLPDVNGVLDSRQLVVAVVKDGDQTAIRVDAQVTWQPARTASEQVPATAKAVTVALTLGLNSHGKKAPEPVTITDPAKVSQVRALINGLKLYPPGAYHCPADFGGTLTLTFRASAGGPALAVATDQLSGCSTLALTVDGKSQPTLTGASGTEVLKLAGLTWKLPTP